MKDIKDYLEQTNTVLLTKEAFEWLKERAGVIEAEEEKEPCEDAISREEAIRIASGYCHWSNIPDELAKLPSVTPKQKMGRWIPVSKKLPNDRDWYLGIFKEPDTGWINPLPFVCDYVGRETKATTKEYWILHGFTDRDERIDYYFNLECVAWMPLPEPMKDGD